MAKVKKSEEEILAAVLKEAKYLCQCKHYKCAHYPNVCEKKHKRVGGENIFLLHPINLRKGHSMTNSIVVCSACAITSGYDALKLDKVSRKKANPNQLDFNLE